MRKSPIAWDMVCVPMKFGGLDVINLGAWIKSCMVKLLWNLCSKEDSLLVRWMHTYDVKREDVM